MTKAASVTLVTSVTFVTFVTFRNVRNYAALFSIASNNTSGGCAPESATF